ncbi:MAG: DUF2125 domain-containing protein [Sulfitobacter sp.]
MRLLIKVCVVLAVLWCGWWWLAATIAERSVTGWFDARRTEGWQAKTRSVEVSGFPLRLGTTVSDIALADPDTGVAFDASALTLSVPAYWPGDVTLRLPEDTVRLATPDGTLTLKAQGAQADLRLHPGTALELEELSAVSGPWQANDLRGNLLSADDLRVAITQDASMPARYRFALDATTLTPGDVIRNALVLPNDWPLSFDAFVADITVLFDLPLDRTTLEDRRPQPRAVDLTEVDLIWGALRLNAKGGLQIAMDGTPDGNLNLRLENWRQILDLAEKAGFVDAGLRQQGELLLNALANMSGGPDTMDLTLAFRDGGMFLGPIYLRPAPKIMLH